MSEQKIKIKFRKLKELLLLNCLKQCLGFYTITQGKMFSRKLHFKFGETCKKYRNKAEMKTHKRTTLLQNDGRKGSQEEYAISAVCVYMQQM